MRWGHQINIKDSTKQYTDGEISVGECSSKIGNILKQSNLFNETRFLMMFQDAAEIDDEGVVNCAPEELYDYYDARKTWLGMSGV